ncbi:MAG: biopolymer transporter ExbD [Kiritimatiellales bacterium]
MSRRKTSLIALKEISDINMTPLMDLTFILLITFIITFPLIEQGVPVNLPTGKASNIGNLESRSITIDKNGRLYFDQLPVTRDELAVELQIIAGIGNEAPVYVRADKEIKYELVADIMVLLHQAGISRMALVTQE